jgi:hypothetical protein
MLVEIGEKTEKYLLLILAHPEKAYFSIKAAFAGASSAYWRFF